MSRNIVLILMLCACALVSTARAEGGCPPGQVPQRGNGWSACVPNGSSNNGTQNEQQNSRVWEARWVALTADAPKNILGQSSESRTQDEAESTAMRDCVSQGGTQCVMAVSAKNGCISMAVNSRFYGVGSGASQETADRKAIAQCGEDGEKDCKIIYDRCVSPAIL
jgi:hypothetical protein